MQKLKQTFFWLGFQRIEEYTSKGGKKYFVCTLCNDHGDIDFIYNHITGDKHTDRYIVSIP